MSKSAKPKFDKIKVKPRKSYVVEIEEKEIEETISSALKAKNDLKNFEEYIEE